LEGVSVLILAVKMSPTLTLEGGISLIEKESPSTIAPGVTSKVKPLKELVDIGIDGVVGVTDANGPGPVIGEGPDGNGSGGTETAL
jgi:hypothetical protein